MFCVPQKSHLPDKVSLALFWQMCYNLMTSHNPQKEIGKLAYYLMTLHKTWNILFEQNQAENQKAK